MEAFIKDYIEQYTNKQQHRMIQLYTQIRELCPEAKVTLSWRMPTFVYHGNLVHFAQHKHHLGFYPGASGIETFTKEFDKLNLKYSKGAVQFPDEQELPLSLIKKIVLFRIHENHKA